MIMLIYVIAPNIRISRLAVCLVADFLLLHLEQTVINMFHNHNENLSF